MMYWAIRSTLCSALWSDAKQLLYQDDAASQDALNGAAVERFEDLRAHAKSFQPPEEEEALSCPLCDCVGVLWTMIVP